MNYLKSNHFTLFCIFFCPCLNVYTKIYNNKKKINIVIKMNKYPIYEKNDVIVYKFVCYCIKVLFES